MQEYTVFVRDRFDHASTTWIGAVDAADLDDAKTAGLEACARDWGFDTSTLFVLGVAEGDVKILCWDDDN